MYIKKIALFCVRIIILFVFGSILFFSIWGFFNRERLITEIDYIEKIEKEQKELERQRQNSYNEIYEDVEIDVPVEPVEVSVKGEISVEWYEQLIKVDATPFLAKIKNFDDTFTTIEEFKSSSSTAFYEAGIVNSDFFASYKYMIFEFPTFGPRNAYVEFLYKNETDELVLITQEKEVSLTSEYSIFDSAANLDIAGVSDLPKQFEHNGVEYVHNFESFEPNTYSFAEDTFAFEFNKFMFYTSDDGCIQVRLPNNVIGYYTPQYNFIEKTETDYLVPSSLVDVSLDDGTDLSKEVYTYHQMGCGGFRSCYKIVKDDLLEELEKVGVTSTGENIYSYQSEYLGIVDSEITELMASYGHQIEYENVFEGIDKKYLILFYKNEFGQLIELTNQRMIPPVECGKPVIYLYPEKDIDVSVNVFPQGGVTVSEPEYGNGWYVRASPDGSIFNYRDNSIYTSLFWESESYGNYIARQGFLIPETKKKEKLDEILIRYGLNELERHDFLEYWTKKLHGSDYYYASILPQHELDTVAPLEITPTPNRVYRIFFNFYPVEKDFVIKEPTVIPIKRDGGFTVVEWGGSY